MLTAVCGVLPHLAQLQAIFYPPQVATIFAFLFVVLTAFFLMNLTIAVLWSTFASSLDSEDTAKDAKALMDAQKELGLLDDPANAPHSDDVSVHAWLGVGLFYQSCRLNR